ncbi:baculoviral IAP repeat-containing protein 3-like, partial [Pseudomyrmex gracilis]|uniref:baculoviral IAP repeat-containing protein 3-like n=1 Tax=Pseudomyrmex gracilis TaxID=219809 RepID=UPI0009959832
MAKQCIPENCQEDYRFESVRLASFKDWSCPWIKPEQLAEVGFYYTSEEDKVKCFDCKLEICKWETNDNPMADHRRWSRQCRFVENLSCDNVADVESNTIPEIVDKKSTCFMSVSSLDDVTEDIGMLNKALSKPKYPRFDTYKARINTLEVWPKLLKQYLANVGFYYTGKDDQTLCYYCGGGLRDWNPEDVPWEQHAKWFEYCPFLIVCKGRDYINTVINGTYYTKDNSTNSSEEVQEADKKSDEDTDILRQN